MATGIIPGVQEGGIPGAFGEHLTGVIMTGIMAIVPIHLLTAGLYTIPGYTTGPGAAGTIPGIMAPDGTPGAGMEADSMAEAGMEEAGDPVDTTDTRFQIPRALFMAAAEVAVRPLPGRVPSGFRIPKELRTR